MLTKQKIGMLAGPIVFFILQSINFDGLPPGG